jgi:hypothetical protein
MAIQVPCQYLSTLARTCYLSTLARTCKGRANTPAPTLFRGKAAKACAVSKVCVVCVCLSLQLPRRLWCQACEGSQEGWLCVTRLKLIGTAVMRYTHCTWPLSASCPKHFILIVRLPLTTMLLTNSPLSLILTLTLVRSESFLFPFWGAYRDCFHVFLSLCVFLRLHTWRVRHSQPLFATRTCVFL